MVTSITLGNFYTTEDGKNVLGGSGGSGLDTETIINTLVEAKEFPAIQDQATITENGLLSDKLAELSALISTFELAADALRSPPGVGNAASDAFQFTTPVLTVGTATAPASDYLSVSTEAGATLQTYTLDEITQVATTARQTSGIFTIADVDADSVVNTSPGAQEFLAGTFTVNGASITLVDGDTLGTVAAKFNAVSDTSGINATVIQVSGTTYQLSFAATASGSTNNFDLTDDPGTVVDASGVLANITFNADVEADDAIFDINGVTVTRSSNSISDVIDGITFTLLQVTGNNKSLVLEVSPDKVTVQNTIVAFAQAYNAIKEFAAQQTQLDSDGTLSDDALLASNIAFRSILTNISLEVTAQVSGLTGDYTSLSDVGITLVDQPASGETPAVSNILNIDDSALTTALATDFTGVRDLFGIKLTTANTDIALFDHDNTITVSSFTLDLDPLGAGTFEATYDLGAGDVTVDLTATAITGSTGYILTGQAGTALEGLEIIYASDATVSGVSVTLTQGIAARLFKVAELATASESDSGTIAVEIASIQDQNDDLEANIARIDVQVEQFRQSLIAKFSALEQAISRVNTLLQSLDAEQNARQNS